MFQLNTYDYKLDIKLENGLYIIHPTCKGKTFLAKLLIKYQAYGEPVASYTYADKIHGTPIETILTPNKFKLIMIDRYDMYKGYGIELAEECARNSIVLIDCKYSGGLSDIDKWCYLEVKGDTIVVDD